MKKRSTDESKGAVHSAECECRLNKAIAQAGYCSRRKADELIFSGRVKVNGNVETNAATKISMHDKLEVDGKALYGPQRRRYILLHKPPQVVCTVSDPENRQTVIDLLPDSLRAERLYPVGRLDYFSEGLILLTNDGDLAQKLMHPSHGHTKLYEVLVRGSVPEAALEAMRSGMTVPISDGAGKSAEIKLAPVSVFLTTLPNGDTMMNMELRQGVNRQIRRICDKLGLTILRLKRVAQGPLQLGNLPKGKWRELGNEEVEKLREGDARSATEGSKLGKEQKQFKK